MSTIALTEEQVDGLALIRAPMGAKRRAKYPWWRHDWTVELEAVSPVDLAQIVETVIEGITDAESRQAVIEREAEERAELLDQMDG